MMLKGNNSRRIKFLQTFLNVLFCILCLHYFSTDTNKVYKVKSTLYRLSNIKYSQLDKIGFFNNKFKYVLS